MDHATILKRAWNNVWRYRALWVFGIILALTTASGGGQGAASSARDGGNGRDRYIGEFTFPDDFSVELGDGIRQEIKELERLLGIHEQSRQWYTYIQMSVTEARKDNQEKADFAFRRVMSSAERFADNAEVLNGIAWQLAINDVRLDTALRLAQRAVELSPASGHIWDTLGEAHARRGEYREAVKAQEKAVELSPDEPLFRERLETWRAELEE